MIHRCKPACLAALTAVLLLVAFLSPALGDKINGDDGEPAVQLARVKVTIDAKTKHFVETNIGDRWQITKYPLIIGTNGQQVALKDMPVPCDVEILYYPDPKGIKKAYRIDIKSYSSMAHKRYSDSVE